MVSGGGAGTAPGSERLISMSVYRHSRLATAHEYSAPGRRTEGAKGEWTGDDAGCPAFSAGARCPRAARSAARTGPCRQGSSPAGRRPHTRRSRRCAGRALPACARSTTIPGCRAARSGRNLEGERRLWFGGERCGEIGRNLGRLDGVEGRPCAVALGLLHLGQARRSHARLGRQAFHLVAVDPRPVAAVSARRQQKHAALRVQLAGSESIHPKQSASSTMAE